MLNANRADKEINQIKSILLNKRLEGEKQKGEKKEKIEGNEKLLRFDITAQ